MIIIYITGTYLNDNMYENVIMSLKTRLAELMAMIEPNLYKNFVVVNIKGDIMLYVKIYKALYGY